MALIGVLAIYTAQTFQSHEHNIEWPPDQHPASKYQQDIWPSNDLNSIK